MINSGAGDLLESNVEALVNTVNCVGVMGKGIALQFKRRYPEVFRTYKRACDAGAVRLGRVQILPTEEMTGPKWVINFPTKGHWKARSRLADIEAGLQDLRRTLVQYDIGSVAIPPLGAGNGGLDWSLVRPLIESALGDLDLEVILFEPSGRSAYAVQGARYVRMTPARALLLRLVDLYAEERLDIEPWSEPHTASHLEIQKLMYFAEVFDPSLDLRFERGPYGPYSERVRHLIAEMEGRYLRGYGDGSGRVLSLDPIQVTDEGARELARFMRGPEGAAIEHVASNVVAVTQGFANPYGVELLTTTFEVARTVGLDPDVVTREIHAWTARKKSMFTRAHVQTAIDHLETVAM